MDLPWAGSQAASLTAASVRQRAGSRAIRASPRSRACAAAARPRRPRRRRREQPRARRATVRVCARCLGWSQPQVGEHVPLGESGRDQEIVRSLGVVRKTEDPAATGSVEGAGAKVDHVALGSWRNDACGLEVNVVSGQAKIDSNGSVDSPAESLARMAGRSVGAHAAPGFVPAVADQGRDAGGAERDHVRRWRSQCWWAAPVAATVGLHLDDESESLGAGGSGDLPATLAREGDHGRPEMRGVGEAGSDCRLWRLGLAVQPVARDPQSLPGGLSSPPRELGRDGTIGIQVAERRAWRGWSSRGNHELAVDGEQRPQLSVAEIGRAFGLTGRCLAVWDGHGTVECHRGARSEGRQSGRLPAIGTTRANEYEQTSDLCRDCSRKHRVQ